MSEQAKFQEWWESKGTNSVILRAQAWSAWSARAEVDAAGKELAAIDDRLNEPAKNRVRLWISVAAIDHFGAYIVATVGTEKSGDWQEIKHDGEGFYVEEQA